MRRLLPGPEQAPQAANQIRRVPGSCLPSEGVAQCADARMQAVVQGRMQTLMNNSPKAAQTVRLQETLDASPQAAQMKAMESVMDGSRPQEKALNSDAALPDIFHASTTPVVQAVSDGTIVDRPLLGDVVQNRIGLAQWDEGEFIANDLQVISKDQQHVHVFLPTLDSEQVTFQGHVVSSKKGAQRNQTPHEIKGIKDENDAWTVTAFAGTPRKQIPEDTYIPVESASSLAADLLGHPRRIFHAQHDDFASRLRESTREAVEYMMNMPDEKVEPGKQSAQTQKEQRDKEKQDEIERKQAEAARNQTEVDLSMGDLFGTENGDEGVG